MTAKTQTQTAYDVIVVGSGAGAMTAAVFAAERGLSVLVVEKSAQFGGTSAISGGGIWIPNNHHFIAKNGNDSPEKAWTYLQNAVGDRVDEQRLRAYLDAAPKMVAELEACSRVRFAVAEKYPDYYPHLEGSLPGGRSLDPEIFDASVLEDEFDNMRPASATTLLMGKIAWTARQAHKAMSRSFGWRLMLIWLILRYKLDFKWRRKTDMDRRTALGASLVASLRRSLMDRKVPLWLNTDFRELLTENGRVSGVRVEREGQMLELSARHGVILASGGFEQNQQLRERYLPKPTERAWSATPPGNNTGAALEAAQSIGAATDLLDWGWWAPTIAVPGEEKPRPIFAERAFPGSIVVNCQGKRFVNEAAPYLEFVDAMYRDQRARGDDNLSVWVIIDAHFRFNYAMGPLMPGQIMPDSKLPAEWLNTMYFKADSLEQLAGQIGVDAQGLVDSVKRLNEYAKTGDDVEFGRGGNVFDRYYGDVNVKPNPCLAPLLKAPFYAMRIDAGDIGTKGGLLTNAHAQVLHESGQPIEGLYAIGNTSSSVLGTTYPGAGGTLGPAMTFGYIAARHLAEQR
ncbi:FAD-dependent oxidoreductase [Pseudomonas sp. TTU2014-080ASC]|uniref:FAD-dependent oxidoreductase n=1 Tax=Pseudomonas sp. TTU2014-080ASC TaxID=1729724 RepID=UPI000718375F|nr:FAD-dependent oxidoreductase [Pseudomonas sp. TTU2014-080ASC]KRW58442.1 3-oxosteroid 1-dehydrogenase [Pseudomonas sp. TTU2014-080ASC]